jgi:HAD superfamily hydrolase (TIGR01549 family)
MSRWDFPIFFRNLRETTAAGRVKYVGQNDRNQGPKGYMYELILFDFDGTIADSLHQGLAHYNSLAGQFGFLPVTDVDAARQMKTKAFFKAHKIPLRRLPGLYREFMRLQHAYMPNVRLFEEIKDVVETLTQHFRVGILSSNTEENIHACLRANGAEGLFDFVFSHTSIFGKHKSMRKILKNERLAREQVVYVGDELRDLKAATKCRIDACAVTWGMHTEKVLTGEQPRYIARRPVDLLRIFGVAEFRLENPQFVSVATS